MRKLPDYGDDGGAVDGDGEGDEEGGTGTESDTDQHVGRMEMESEEDERGAEQEQGHFSFGNCAGEYSALQMQRLQFIQP